MKSDPTRSFTSKVEIDTYTLSLMAEACDALAQRLRLEHPDNTLGWKMAANLAEHGRELCRTAAV